MLIFPKIILAVFLAFFGIAGAAASYVATPVKQYQLSNGATYSDWYNIYRSELARADNGPLYGAEYQKHFALWLRVEGLAAPEMAARNPKRILTVPVSGTLAKRANFYFIRSDSGDLTPEEVVIEKQTYVKSSAKGAAGLYTITQTKQAALPPAPTALPKSGPATVPVADTPPKILPAINNAAESFVMTEMIFTVAAAMLLCFVIWHFIADHRRLKKNLTAKEKELEHVSRLFEELKTENGQYRKEYEETQEEIFKKDDLFRRLVRPFVLENKDLIGLIRQAKIFTIHDENTLYFPIIGEGRDVLFPGDVCVKNENKNILAAVRQLHKGYESGVMGTVAA
ncbi:MAG: hypothetical protein HYT94_00840 [Parcubacteria group bacterium]|nr:hypothetical protein [Parcubacteria group bacterium]